jgi:hypothetical protein
MENEADRIARAIREWYGNDGSEPLSDLQFDEFGSDALGMGSELLGICKQCGTVQSPVEPDARSNPCESCGVPAVTGFQEILMSGFEG